MDQQTSLPAPTLPIASDTQPNSSGLLILPQADRLLLSSRTRLVFGFADWRPDTAMKNG
jgi:hypothetical protein